MRRKTSNIAFYNTQCETGDIMSSVATARGRRSRNTCVFAQRVFDFFFYYFPHILDRSFAANFHLTTCSHPHTKVWLGQCRPRRAGAILNALGYYRTGSIISPERDKSTVFLRSSRWIILLYVFVHIDLHGNFTIFPR